MATIAGNVGGSAASGALVQVRSKNGDESKLVVADGSGNYTVTVAGASGLGKQYILTASLAGKVYRNSACVTVVATNISDVNLAFNAPTDPSVYV